MPQERRKPNLVSSTLLGYLDQLPARVLLDRVPVPMLAVGMDAVVAYANLACAQLLGYPEDASMAGQRLSELLIEHPGGSLRGPVSALRAAAGSVTGWAHCDGSTVRAVVSESVLMREDDPVLLVSLTDVTEWEWSTGPRPAATPIPACDTASSMVPQRRDAGASS